MGHVATVATSPLFVVVEGNFSAAGVIEGLFDAGFHCDVKKPK